MYFAIDLDTRIVLTKSEDGELLREQIAENNLELAIALISEEDDLSLELSLGEMKDIYCNLEEVDKSKFNDEEHAASVIWQTLLDHEDDFPDYVSAKMLLTGETPKPKAEVKPKAKPKGIRAKELIGMVFNNCEKSPRNGSAMAIITDFIDMNLGEATLEELVEGFCDPVDGYQPKKSNADVDEKCAMGYIRGAFNEGYIEEAL